MFTDDDLLEPERSSIQPSQTTKPATASRYERTEVPFPTHGPSDSETWAAYFRRVKHGDEPDEPEEDEEEDDGLGETIELGFLDDLEWKDWAPNAALTYAKLLQKCGFEVKGGYRLAFHEGGVFGKTAKQAGEKKPDKTVRWVFVNGYKPGRGLVKVAYRDSGSGKFAPYLRTVSGSFRIWPDAELKEWIKHEPEAGDSDHDAPAG
jgi:hypothetical protein